MEFKENLLTDFEKLKEAKGKIITAYHHMNTKYKNVVHTDELINLKDEILTQNTQYDRLREEMKWKVEKQLDIPHNKEVVTILEDLKHNFTEINLERLPFTLNKEHEVNTHNAYNKESGFKINEYHLIRKFVNLPGYIVKYLAAKIRDDKKLQYHASVTLDTKKKCYTGNYHIDLQRKINTQLLPELAKNKIKQAKTNLKLEKRLKVLLEN